MLLIDWLKRIKTNIEIAINSKLGKRLLFLCFAIFFMLLGMAIYAILSTKIESPFKALGFYLSLVTAPLTIILVFIDRIFTIEIKEKDLQIKEKTIDSLNTDPGTISNKIANSVISIISNKLKTTDSIYEDREKHYSKEKEVLAKHMYELLDKRIDYLIRNENKNIRIFFDSGTTIAPLLDYMGMMSSSSNDTWPEKVEIITNNIRGLHYLLKYRKNTTGSNQEEDDRYVRIPFDCRVLPGKILSAFQAIVGESTFSALEILKNRSSGFYTIAVTTGNYVLMDTWKRQVLPIARADFHPNFKAGLYYVSDEVYMVAPLGKILRNKNTDDDNLESLLSRFNADLKHDDKSHIESKRNYKIIDPNLLDKLFNKKHVAKINMTEWHKKTVLVTTSRAKGKHLFAPHFELVYSTFPEFNCEMNIASSTENIPHLSYCAFYEIQPWQRDQIEIEIPHKNLRPFSHEYFSTEPN